MRIYVFLVHLNLFANPISPYFPLTPMQTQILEIIYPSMHSEVESKMFKNKSETSKLRTDLMKFCT